MAVSESGPSKSKLVEPKRLKGFKDHMPIAMNMRTKLQGIIREYSRLAGFQEIGTPALEYLETLLGQGSEETDKQVYRFEDHGGRKVGLRFDLTIPFARFVAEHQGEIVFPFKRLQIGDVWRGENTQKGRYREFCQCDLDIIGVDSINADMEILACIFSILSKFELGGFTIRIGNRLVLTSLIKKFFPNAPAEVETSVLIAIDKMDKIGAEGVVELLTKSGELDRASVLSLVKSITSNDSLGDTDHVGLKALLDTNQIAIDELTKMQEILGFLRTLSSGSSEGKVVLDYSIARGLGYYTGIVYETTLDRLPGFGSISSGGRYDNLAERFTTRRLPGVGGSIGLDRVLAGIEELQIPLAIENKTIFIAVATQDALRAAMTLATRLRQNRIACDFGLTTGKVGNQFKHADRLGCPFVVTLGTQEVNESTYNLKNMKSGEEFKGLSQSNIIERLSELLK